ncbi:nucleoside hydrolase [Stieleria sp. TO1_6]|uniref:nucleoside hydrolase n=1 Tax=Stieleria tagensis TaxID=2956795 RepID=UPI00209B68AF|nr:nucleoside hydrolase [Stieleria tagensis]MCO8120524.1 nucleoside hydrolase [Stieleria tagensis]
MKKMIPLRTIAFLAISWMVSLADPTASAQDQQSAAFDAPVHVIFDTDMASDCDDVGALAVLHALADSGEAEILAVVTNRKCPANASAAVCDVVNTFYGRPDIPIGSDKDGAKVTWNKPSSFTPSLRDEFPHDMPADDAAPDALEIYRKTLASQPDRSVVICSVGALSNLADLLDSPPDQHSPLHGDALIRQKVKQTVVMGGHFPRSAQPETNIRLDPAAAVTVVNRWPTEIIWQGYEIGAVLHCGKTLRQEAADNPVRRAFEIRPFLGGKAIDHGKPAHDQAAVLIAVRGIDPKRWKLSPIGHVVVDSDGHTEWRPEQNGRHRFVQFATRPQRIAETIETLMQRKQ